MTDTFTLIAIDEIVETLSDLVADLNRRKNTRRDDNARIIAVAITHIEDGILRLAHASDLGETP